MERRELGKETVSLRLQFKIAIGPLVFELSVLPTHHSVMVIRAKRGEVRVGVQCEVPEVCSCKTRKTFRQADLLDMNF